MPARPDAAWLDRAREDLRSAELLAAHGGHPDTICFLCQQAVEKALKGALTRVGIAPPKIHDLVALARAARAAGLPDSAPDGDLAFLAGCYLASRYPMLAMQRMTPADASRARRVADAVCGVCDPAPPRAAAGRRKGRPGGKRRT